MEMSIQKSLDNGDGCLYIGFIRDTHTGKNQMAKFKITVRRVIESEVFHDAETLSKARKWARDYGLDDLQHEGCIISDIPRIASVKPA